MIEMLEHIHQKKALKEIYRVMKKKGFLCLGIPTLVSERLYNFLNPLYLRKAAIFIFLKKEEIISKLRSLGFQILKIKKENFVLAIFWTLNSLLKINPSSTGEINRRALLTRVYFKVWGMLHVLKIAPFFIVIRN